jgi:hypothetical protein
MAGIPDQVLTLKAGARTLRDRCIRRPLLSVGAGDAYLKISKEVSVLKQSRNIGRVACGTH